MLKAHGPCPICLGPNIASTFEIFIFLRLLLLLPGCSSTSSSTERRIFRRKMAASPSKSEILSLFRSFLRVAREFSDYNIREYAKRRTVDGFRHNRLLSDPSSIAAAYADAESQLNVAKRQVIVYSLYAPKLKSVMEIKHAWTLIFLVFLVNFQGFEFCIGIVETDICELRYKKTGHLNFFFWVNNWSVIFHLVSKWHLLPFYANFVNLFIILLVNYIELGSWVLGLWRVFSMMCKWYYGRYIFAGFWYSWRFWVGDSYSHWKFDCSFFFTCKVSW